MNVEGRSMMRCKITDEGRLNECVALSEAPAGMGFGEAELRAAREFRAIRPASGAPIYSQREVLLPMTWSLPK
jgi:hypothetical protein